MNLDLTKLTEEERAQAEMLLRKLGMMDKEKVIKIKTCTLQEYFLRIKVRCQLCEAHFNINLHMVADLTQWDTLHSNRMEEFPEGTNEDDIKIELKYQSTCPYCQNRLMQLEKEELVKKLIKLKESSYVLENHKG